jgi:phosphatidate cytidylyltransferase
VSELTQRVLFAVLAVPVVVGLAWLGGAPLATLLAVAAALAAWEFGRLAAASGARPLTGWLIGGAAAIPLLAHAAHLGLGVPPLPIVALVVPMLLGVALWRRGVAGHPLAAVASTLLGIWYTGGLLSFAYALRHHRFAIGAAAGTALLFVPLVVTWVTDAGAFFVGRAIGGAKLMPSVSPGKTWSGAIGGSVLGVVGAWAFSRWVLQPVAQLGLGLGGVVVLGLTLSVAAQVGDLVESLLKREAGVKDSSRLIPGHGGILDRTDSLLFTLPLGYVLLDFLLRVGA